MTEPVKLEPGMTVYIEGHEQVITQVRIDESYKGVNGLIWTLDPLAIAQMKLDEQNQRALLAKQGQVIDQALGTEGRSGS